MSDITSNSLEEIHEFEIQGAGILLALMSALSCQTDEFDLDYIPKDKAETSVVTQRMLATGEEIAYRKEHEGAEAVDFPSVGCE